jgi:hypothetical protein
MAKNIGSPGFDICTRTRDVAEVRRDVKVRDMSDLDMSRFWKGISKF